MIAKVDYEIAQSSLCGNRSINQDRSIVLTSPEGSILLALADGLGGHPRGEVAAQILVEASKRLFAKIEKPVADPERFLAALLHAAHLEIVDYGLAHDPVITPRTTAVVALVQNNRVHWAHVGDSRFYLLRNGRVLLHTEDHSMVQQMRQRGMISAEEAEAHPQRNFVTRSLGGTHARLDITHGESAELNADDIILLCSDGLWGQIDSKGITQVLREPRSTLDRLARILAHKAEALGYPESDNVTLAAVRWRGTNAAKDTQPLPAASETGHPPEIDDEPRRDIDLLRDTLDAFDDDIDIKKEEHPHR
ncbi:MAG TPA: serine/threonine-protein phosphatase [Chromatiales bacterium]|nr:serine/threonine-protein phosphatase [Chromatiales bacterium]